MEKKTTTYGDLKCRKQEMRNEGVIVTEMEEYIQTINAIKDAEAVLLRSISDKEKNGELGQVKAKARYKVKYAVIAISIVIVLWLLAGCQTFKGATGDSAWMLQKLSDNVVVEKNK